MSKPYDIAGYIYAADVYCPVCIIDQIHTRGDLIAAYPAGFDTEAYLDRASTLINIDRYDESTFDSDYFPKVIFADMVEGDVCAECGGPLDNSK